MTKDEAIRKLRLLHGLLDSGRHADALQFCNDELAMAEGADAAIMLKYRSYVWGDCGQHRSAISDLEEALKLCPADRSILHALACAHARTGDWRSATIAAERLLSEEKMCNSTYYLDEAYLILAMGFKAAGDMDKARALASMVSNGGSTWLGELLTKDELLRRLS